MCKFKKEYVITTNMLDCYDNLKISSILDIAQDIASEHGDILKVGYNDFFPLGLIWVIVRNKVEIIKNIKNIKKVEVETELVKFNLIECPRDYIFKYNNEIIAKVRSVWMIYDINKLEVVSPKKYNTLDVENLGIFPNRIKKILLIKKENLTYIDKYKVKFSTLDHNNHMNNTTYFNLYLDYLKPIVDEEVESLQIEYIKQAFLDEELDLYYLKDGSKIYFSGYNLIKDELKFYMEINLKCR